MRTPISALSAGRGLWRAAALACWTLAGAGCTQSGVISPPGDGNPLSTPDKPCTRPLDGRGCAPTFDEQDSLGLLGPFCRGENCCTFRGACGEHKVWMSAPDLAGFLCVYDKTGATLVSSRSCSDVPLSECGNGAHCITAGAPLESLALCEVATLPRRCFFDSPERRARSCEVPLDDARAFCRATFSQQQTNPPPKSPVSSADRIVVGQCGDTQVWSGPAGATGRPYGPSSASCVYGGDGQLVSAEFCGQESESCRESCRYAGPAVPSPLECTLTTTILPYGSGAGGGAP